MPPPMRWPISKDFPAAPKPRYWGRLGENSHGQAVCAPAFCGGGGFFFPKPICVDPAAQAPALHGWRHADAQVSP